MQFLVTAIGEKRPWPCIQYVWITVLCTVRYTLYDFAVILAYSLHEPASEPDLGTYLSAYVRSTELPRTASTRVRGKKAKCLPSSVLKPRLAD